MLPCSSKPLGDLGGLKTLGGVPWSVENTGLAWKARGLLKKRRICVKNRGSRFFFAEIYILVLCWGSKYFARGQNQKPNIFLSGSTSLTQ